MRTLEDIVELLVSIRQIHWEIFVEYPCFILSPRPHIFKLILLLLSQFFHFFLASGLNRPASSTLEVDRCLVVACSLKGGNHYLRSVVMQDASSPLVVGTGIVTRLDTKIKIPALIS